MLSILLFLAPFEFFQGQKHEIVLMIYSKHMTIIIFHFLYVHVITSSSLSSLLRSKSCWYFQEFKSIGWSISRTVMCKNASLQLLWKCNFQDLLSLIIPLQQNYWELLNRITSFSNVPAIKSITVLLIMKIVIPCIRNRNQHYDNWPPSLLKIYILCVNLVNTL